MAGYMGGVRRGAMGGMSQLAQALAQGPQTERAAYDAEMGLQSKVAQALAQIRQADAGTAKTDAETAFLQNRPGLYEEQAALSAGVDIPTLRAFRQTVQTGQAPQVPMGPETADGEMGVGSMQFDPTQAQRISQALQRMVPVIASGAPIAANDWASASDKYRDQDLSNEILAGTRAPEAVGRAQAAMAGKPLYSVDGNGQVVDLFMGAADASGPVPQGRVRLAESQAAENEAQRQRAIAEAERARAEAARARAESGGRGKPPPGYQWKADGSGQEPIPGGPADPNKPKPSKPLPPAAMKLQQEELEAIGTFAGLDSDLAQFQKQIQDGTLSLGAVANLLNTGRNFAGMSTEQSRNLASFKTKLENMRNAVLLLNKGVQTEGDAQRAMSEIMANINDPKLVSQRLDEIRRLNARAVTLRQNNIDILRRNFEAEPLDLTPYTRQPAAVGAPAAAPSASAAPAAGARSVVRTGTAPDGRKVIQYSDGTVEYAPAR